eukprot:14717-Amorphochlora_amoeboformis.AAC.1
MPSAFTVLTITDTIPDDPRVCNSKISKAGRGDDACKESNDEEEIFVKLESPRGMEIGNILRKDLRA